ncbi:thiol-disulfide oxidoreductase ResA [Pontibacillus salipaludis]|uniref:Thiol-disulfide oxidoreductase ResA n=1 Tax=Pontibacillus salipaludis TaxID=1697394 RepID=A0ABQ1Q4Y9_9BACI|nr:thiol-disulfide oxidoreductase ResA [Pontibacillus salipaludis]GGD13103.1 thiol-disulfide oxidoreductase ResA [Pontibacillus salipaludis]
MKKQKRFIFRTTLLLLFAIAIVYAIYQSYTEDDSQMITEGDQAPDFTLKTLDGETVQLSDYKGQGVFLNFWATYCPPCKEEMPYMESQYQKFKDKGVQILAVDVAEPKVTVERFVTKYELSFPIPMDTNEGVMNAYGVGPIPVTFLINEKGVVEDRITAGLSEEDIHAYMKQIQPDSYKE